MSSSNQAQKTSAAIFSASQLSRRYILALSLIAILTLVSQGVVQFLLADQEHDSRVVNIAGRQRMLSQKITKTAYYIANAATSDMERRYRAELSSAVSLWQSAHVGLLRGDAAMGLPGRNSSETIALFAAIQPHFEAMAAAVQTILSSSTRGAEFAASIRQLTSHEANFLNGMNEIVFRYDSEARAKVVFAKWLEVGLLTLTLLVLLLEAGFIFAPAVRRIKRDTKQLAESETRLRATIDASLDGVVSIDASGGLIDFNHAAEAMFGWKKEEVLGRLMADILVPEQHRQAHQQGIARFAQSRQPRIMNQRVEFTALRRDGSEFPVELTIAAIRQDDRDLFTAYIRDLTERKDAESRLLHQNNVLTTIIDNIPGAISMFDVDLRLVAHNEQFKELLDLPQTLFDKPDIHFEDLIRFNAERGEYGPGDVEEQVAAMVTRTKMMQPHKFERIRPDSKALEVRGVPLSNGGFVTFYIDITERKQAETSLREINEELEKRVEQRTLDLRDAKEAAEASERFMHVVADAIPAQIAYLNRDTCFEFTNKAYREWFGKSAEEMQDIHLRDLLGEELFSQAQPLVARALQGETLSFLRTATREGKQVHLWVNYVPDLQDGQVRGIFGLVSDITEVKNAQSELERLNEQLSQRTLEAEAANIAKSAFLANMSHEIRTPMNGIIGMAHILRRKGVTAEQARHLDTIDTSAQHLLSVINDILDISKIEAGKLTLEEAPVVVSSLMANVSSILSERVKANGIRLLIETGHFPHKLVGDPTRLQQALLNFAANAVKFTEQGSVTLRALMHDETADSVTVRFEVTDTGIGIASEAMSRLFSTFEQADNTMNRKYGGTGLGLAITKRLAELMGGEAGADSTPGVGSTFWLTVTLRKSGETAEAPTETATDAEAEIRRRYAGNRILVVDDEPVNREVAVMQLEAVDLVVDTAEDGADAIAMALKTRYSAIFMDVQMPQVNGLEATREIRHIP